MLKNFKRTLVIIVAIIVVIVGSYLFINRSNDGEKIKAIAKVKSIYGYNNFPGKPEKVSGSLYEGGPSPDLKIPGELETKVNLKSDATYQVTFIEYWNSKDFKFQGSKDGIQSSFITFEVNGDNVKCIEHGGELPPELVK